MGKGEIAHNEQFLLFPQCFLLNQIIVSPFVHIFGIISLLAAELEEPKIGLSGKGLKDKWIIQNKNSNITVSADLFRPYLCEQRSVKCGILNEKYQSAQAGMGRNISLSFKCSTCQMIILHSTESSVDRLWIHN